MLYYYKSIFTNMSSFFTFATIALVIGAAITYQKPLTNILTNLAQKAGQAASPPSPLPPSPGPAPTTPAAPSQPTTTTPTGPTVAGKGGTDRFGVTHFYPDKPSGVQWYMTACQTANGPSDYYYTPSLLV